MKHLLIALTLLLTPFAGPSAASSTPWLASGPIEEPIVRAVLFYAPTCPHCHQVITQDLPRIFAQYGGQPQVRSIDGDETDGLVAHFVWNDRLHLLLVDVSRSVGGQLYRGSMERFTVPEDRLGVPQLVLDERVLVGSLEIPRDLPGLIEQGLAEGGADWPSIPGLTDVVALVLPDERETRNVRPEAAPEASRGLPDPSNETVAASATEMERPESDDPLAGREAAETYLNSLATGAPPGLAERLGRDPVGNGLATAVLVGMLISLAVVVRLPRRQAKARMPGLVIPILLLVGIAVAAYLAYVETQGATAVCGPVGDCNAVQQSPYAMLFGVVPVALAGLAGYLLMLGGWVVSKVGERSASDVGTAGFFLVAVLGTLFSIYLTFLEPFVIGAVCAWCLSSAVLITALMLLSARAGVAAVRRIARETRS